MNETYADRWRQKERDLGFDDGGITLLTCGEWMLPSDAAPCLSFDRAARPRLIWEVFGTPSQWSAEERERLAAYRMIGSDGAGNPICVQTDTGVVWLLDHEDQFRTLQFVNSSGSQLAECLLAYFGERDGERFRSAVRSIDAPALAEQTFWWYAAVGLEADDVRTPP